MRPKNLNGPMDGWIRDQANTANCLIVASRWWECECSLYNLNFFVCLRDCSIQEYAPVMSGILILGKQESNKDTKIALSDAMVCNL